MTAPGSSVCLCLPLPRRRLCRRSLRICRRSCRGCHQLFSSLLQLTLQIDSGTAKLATLCCENQRCGPEAFLPRCRISGAAALTYSGPRAQTEARAQQPHAGPAFPEATSLQLGRLPLRILPFQPLRQQGCKTPACHSTLRLYKA